MINGGLYFVVDISAPSEKLIDVIKKAIAGGVDILQLWSEGKDLKQVEDIAREIVKMAHERGIPVIIANDIDLCLKINADGVHLDGYEIPEKSCDEIRKILGWEKIVGLTCGNSAEKIKWARENSADYISFCSIFPSSSVTSCEIVPLEMIKKAKEIVDDMPVFASGGITLENAEIVLSAGADGLAVVSAILYAEDPEETARKFKEKILRFAKRKISG